MKIAYATQYNENSKWQHWEDKIGICYFLNSKLKICIIFSCDILTDCKVSSMLKKKKKL